MSEGPLSPEERTQRNLQAVARHSLRAEPVPEDGAFVGKLKTWGPVGVGLLFLLGKAKWVLGLLKFAKLGTLLSMVLTIGVYAQFFGWSFAVGFVLLIFVHEMGHAIAMKRLGIPAGAPVFIPFFGAFIAMRGMPKNAWVESVVGIAGPLLGTVGAAACLVVGLATGSLFWHALAFSGFMINLFNMLPLHPMDGGRVLEVISRRVRIVGLIGGAIFFVMTWSPVVFLILLLGLFQIRAKMLPSYYDVPVARRVSMGLAYAGLVTVMVLGMSMTEGPLASLAPAQEAALKLGSALAGLALATRR